MHWSIRFVAACLCASMIGAGCASSYTVPGGPAKMAMMRAGPEGVRNGNTAGVTVGSAPAAVQPVPMADFPAMIAFARVQATGYRSRTVTGYGSPGSMFSLITTRDVESDDALNRLAKLPGVAGVAPMNRLLLADSTLTEAELRDASRRVNADMLVLYTFDTQFYTKDYAAPLSVVTLGLSPNKKAFVSTTATALIVDSRTGYVYGGAETTDKTDQAANSWTTEDAVDDSRRRTEARAFDKLVGELEKTWPNIVSHYASPTTQP